MIVIIDIKIHLLSGKIHVSVIPQIKIIRVVTYNDVRWINDQAMKLWLDCIDDYKE